MTPPPTTAAPTLIAIDDPDHLAVLVAEDIRPHRLDDLVVGHGPMGTNCSRVYPSWSVEGHSYLVDVAGILAAGGRIPTRELFSALADDGTRVPGLVQLHDGHLTEHDGRVLALYVTADVEE